MSDKPDAYRKERQVALVAVTTAARLCERVRRAQQAQAIAKPDASPVTIADFGAQALICRTLAAVFPADAIVGEEDAQLLGRLEMAACLEAVTAAVGQEVPGATAADVLGWVGQGRGQAGDRFWTLDPIDGTKGYVRGDQYAIALALIEDGQVQLGVMACPALPVNPNQSQGNPSELDEANRGVIFVGVRGGCAEMIAMGNGESRILRVRGEADRADFRLIESVELDHGTPARQQAVAQAVGITAPPLRMDSLGKYGAIARGEADLYLRLPSGASELRRENIWDHAAGVVVLEAAGGRVSDREGKPLDFSCGSKLENNQGIVASNAALHEAVLAALKAL